MTAKFKNRPKKANHREFRRIRNTPKAKAKPFLVTAKVGIITYTGFISTADGAFHYTTKGGVSKFSKKFTVVGEA